MDYYYIAKSSHFLIRIITWDLLSNKVVCRSIEFFRQLNYTVTISFIRLLDESILMIVDDYWNNT